MLLCVCMALCGGLPLHAQGVTGAAVQGTVAGADSTPVGEATVLVTNSATGERWQALTQANGRFYLEHLSIGGPYRLDVRAVGFRPAERTAISLSLGQRLTFDVTLIPAAVELPELVVRGVIDPRINGSRTGPALTISDSVIDRLPIFGRDFGLLVQLSPQATMSPNGASFGGAHDRLNSVLVDGATTQDLKGGLGREAGLIPLPPEALQEIKVLAAPFDVRYGNFAGGLIQAVSKSGTNQWHGSVYGYTEGQGLNGTSPDGTRGGQDTRREAGLTVGGPILHDRVAAFVSANGKYNLFGDALAPNPNAAGGLDSATGIRYTTMVRFQDILRNQYGVDPGAIASGKYEFSNRSLFVKVTAQLGLNSRLELSHNYLYQLDRLPYSFGFNAGLSSNAEDDPTHDNTTQLSWTSAPGATWANELILARNTKRHRCVPHGSFPTVEVVADEGDIVGGIQEVCRGQENGQSILALTDNLGWTVGTHQLTLGAHTERVRLYDDDAGLSNSAGRWHFASLDSLQQGLPDIYRRDLPGPLLPPAGRPDFTAVEIGAYLQDQWAPTTRLTLMAGLRVDVPFLPTHPTRNVDVLQAFGVNTARTPSGHALWSPRIGVSYDLSGRGTSFVRGGIGWFEGRPSYSWLEEAYRGTGLQQISLRCFDDDVPTFTLTDPQPTSCGNGAPATPVISAFDPAFRYPQNLKISLGADQRLPWNVVATVDLLYTRGVHQFALRDLNLLPPTGASAGEGGRALYGTIDPASGGSEVNLRNSAFQQVVQITNGSADRAWSLALQLQKQFPNGNELGISYTYTDAKNREDAPGGSSLANLAVTVVDGTRERPNLRTSIYETRHQVRFLAALDLPFKVKLGLFFLGGSGSPFTYVILGDANADGLGQNGDHANDAVYVPAGENDITLVNPEDPGQPASAEEHARLSRYIASERCLRSQRGRVLQRNSCRQPWQSELDARLSKVVRIAGTHTLEISTQLFNVLNFLDRDWGRKYAIGNGINYGQIALLNLVGYDEANGRGIYTFLPPERREFQVESTRWQMQLGAKYAF